MKQRHFMARKIGKKQVSQSLWLCTNDILSSPVRYTDLKSAFHLGLLRRICMI